MNQFQQQPGGLQNILQSFLVGQNGMGGLGQILAQQQMQKELFGDLATQPTPQAPQAAPPAGQGSGQIAPQAPLPSLPGQPPQTGKPGIGGLLNPGQKNPFAPQQVRGATGEELRESNRPRTALEELEATTPQAQQPVPHFEEPSHTPTSMEVDQLLIELEAIEGRMQDGQISPEDIDRYEDIKRRLEEMQSQ